MFLKFPQVETVSWNIHLKLTQNAKLFLQRVMPVYTLTHRAGETHFIKYHSSFAYFSRGEKSFFKGLWLFVSLIANEAKPFPWRQTPIQFYSGRLFRGQVRSQLSLPPSGSALWASWETPRLKSVNELTEPPSGQEGLSCSPSVCSALTLSVLGVEAMCVLMPVVSDEP